MDLKLLAKQISDGIEQRSRRTARNLLMRNEFSREEADSFIQLLLDKLPNLKGELRKFYYGLTRWFLTDLDIQNPQDVYKVNKLLYNLRNTPEADFYDKDFNGLSIKDVQDISRIDLEAEPYQTPPDTSYEVFELTDFDKVCQYENYANWCILDETVFKAYTANGLKYFIAERSDFKEVPKLRGDDYPYDDYGMSLIIIGVEDNEIVSVTSRWNFDDTGDSYLKPQQLKKLLGRKYNFLFE